MGKDSRVWWRTANGSYAYRERIGLKIFGFIEPREKDKWFAKVFPGKEKEFTVLEKAEKWIEEMVSGK
jgi:hypothetical protein